MLFTINQWLSKRMFICVLSALAVGYAVPLHPTASLQNLSLGLFAYMTLITSAGTSFKQFAKVLKRPRIPLYILFLLHCAVPVVAWLIGLCFFPDDLYTRIGYLISAAIPIGVTSMIWVSVVKGNVPISLVAVTLDSLVTPIILPLYFQWIIGTEIKLNYQTMAVDLFCMVTIPSIMGMLLHDVTKGAIKKYAQGFGGVTAKMALFTVVALNASFVGPEITWNLNTMKILLVTFLSVASGYLLGYVGSLLFQRGGRDIAYAVIYNTGMRNTSLGLVIALTYFPHAVAIPITLSMLFQQPIAATVPYLYRKLAKTTDSSQENSSCAQATNKQKDPPPLQQE